MKVTWITSSTWCNLSDTLQICLLYSPFRCNCHTCGAQNYLQLQKVMHSSGTGFKFTKLSHTQNMHAREVKGTPDTPKMFFCMLFVLSGAPCHKNPINPWVCSAFTGSKYIAPRWWLTGVLQSHLLYVYLSEMSQKALKFLPEHLIRLELIQSLVLVSQQLWPRFPSLALMH